MNRKTGSRLLVSGLPGSPLRTHVESLGKPRDVNKRWFKHILFVYFVHRTTYKDIQ